MKRLVTIGLYLTLMGCVAVPEVTSSDTSDAINTVALSCQKPYEFTQDCNNWAGASRKIIIDGFEIKVGATANGNTVLVMDAKLFANSLTSVFTVNSPKHSRASNNSFESVKKVFAQNNVKINRVRPLKSFANIDGYILELPSDGYSILKKYSVDKS